MLLYWNKTQGNHIPSPCCTSVTSPVRWRQGCTHCIRTWWGSNEIYRKCLEFCPLPGRELAKMVVVIIKTILCTDEQLTLSCCVAMLERWLFEFLCWFYDMLSSICWNSPTFRSYHYKVSIAIQFYWITPLGKIANNTWLRKEQVAMWSFGCNGHLLVHSSARALCEAQATPEAPQSLEKIQRTGLEDPRVRLWRMYCKSLSFKLL